MDKNAANNASFSVQNKIFPKLKAQILQRIKMFTMVQALLLKEKNCEIFSLSSCFYQSKIVIFYDFLKQNLNSLFYILNLKNFNNFFNNNIL